MILTQSFRAKQPKSLLDELNRESGRIYTLTMVEHWRIKSRKDIWLSQFGAMRINDALAGDSILHAHSKDASQQAFYKACKTSKILIAQEVPDVKYPHKRKFYRTTVWKKSGIKVKDDTMFLAKARGLDPVKVKLPETLKVFEFNEVKLVYNQGSSKYYWFVSYEDNVIIPKPKGQEVVAVDLGEVHPAAVCSLKESQVISCRELRSIIQGRNKKVSEIDKKKEECEKGSKRRKKLQRTKNKISAKFKLKQRDICHKVSRAIVDFAEEQKASKIVIGDVRKIADKIALSKSSNQKISQWPHGIVQNYVTYKAKQKGIEVKIIDESYTSQSCPCCGNLKKPKGRMYKCSKCGWVGHRDGQVGAPNILSLELFGELSRVLVPEVKYRHPYLISRGKRSRVDTTEIAGNSCGLSEASGF